MAAANTRLWLPTCKCEKCPKTAKSLTNMADSKMPTKTNLKTMKLQHLYCLMLHASHILLESVMWVQLGSAEARILRPPLAVSCTCCYQPVFATSSIGLVSAATTLSWSRHSKPATCFLTLLSVHVWHRYLQCCFGSNHSLVATSFCISRPQVALFTYKNAKFSKTRLQTDGLPVKTATCSRDCCIYSQPHFSNNSYVGGSTQSRCSRKCGCLLQLRNHGFM